MKKIVGIMLVLALLLAGAALSEEAEYVPMPKEAGAFEGMWQWNDVMIEMIWEEEGFRVDVCQEEEGQKISEWEYSGFYIAQDQSVATMPLGIRTDYAYDEAGNATYTEVYNDGEATFTLDEAGCLIWQDGKEDAGKDMRFVKIGNSRFEGVWACGRATMEVVFEEEGYRVFIAWGSSAAEHTEWEYSCLYNAQTDTLEAMPFGSCTDVVFDENGEIVSSSVRYEDGEASFALDEAGHLLWWDAKEDAGKDMRFEWVDMIDIGL